MDFLHIALLVLAVIAIWAVVEVALTMRTARRSIDKLTTSASEVIDQAQPVVAKLDGVVDELEPAVKRLGPLMDEADGAVRSADAAFKSLNGVLEDVSTVSGTASSVTDAVNRAAESAVSGVASVVSRIKCGASAKGAPRLEGAEDPEPERTEVRARQEPPRYVEYGAADPAPEDADEAEDK